LEWLSEQGNASDLSSPLCSPSHAENKEDTQRLLSVLSQLPDSHRHLLVLWAFDGLSYDDIALVCDIAVRTVKSRLSRAKERFRELYTQGGEYDE